jgi:hypothetical protein
MITSLISAHRCPICKILVETDCGSGCSDHRDQVKAANKKKMAALREKKAEKWTICPDKRGLL